MEQWNSGPLPQPMLEIDATSTSTARVDNHQWRRKEILNINRPASASSPHPNLRSLSKGHPTRAAPGSRCVDGQASGRGCSSPSRKTCWADPFWSSTTQQSPSQTFE